MKVLKEQQKILKKVKRIFNKSYCESSERVNDVLLKVFCKDILV